MSSAGVRNALALGWCLGMVGNWAAPLWAAADLSIEPAGIEVLPRIPVPGTPSQPFPVLVQKGRPVRFRATVANRGDRNVTGSYAEINVNRYPVGPDQQPEWVGVIAPLDVGAGQTVTLEFTPGRRQPAAFVPQQNGLYIAVVNVDPPEPGVPVRQEQDRENNIAGIPLQIVSRTTGPPAVLALPDLICSEFDQLLVTTGEEPNLHHREVQVGEEVRFLVSCRLEGAGPYCSYVEVEVNPRGAEPDRPPLWHGVLAFRDLGTGEVAKGLARARSPLPQFWTPDKPGEYIIGAVADPGHKDLNLGCLLPRGELIESSGKDTFFGPETEDDAAKRYANNAVFRVLTVRP